MGSKSSKVPDKEFLRLFALSPDPVLSAPEIAKELPISNQAVNKRLNKLERKEILASKEVGSAAKVYWLTQKGKNHLAELE